MIININELNSIIKWQRFLVWVIPPNKPHKSIYLYFIKEGNLEYLKRKELRKRTVRYKEKARLAILT